MPASVLQPLTIGMSRSPRACAAARTAGNFDVFDGEFLATAPSVFGRRMGWLSSVKFHDLFRQRPEWFVLDEPGYHQALANNSTALTETEPGVFQIKLDPPETGYTAYYVELAFPSGTVEPLKFSTGVKVVPDVVEHEWKMAPARARD